MKKAIGFLSVIMLIIGIAFPVYAADVAKIGVIDFQKILDESSAGKLVKKEITDKGQEFQKKLKAEKDQLDEMSKAFEREKLVLSKEKITEKQRDFRIRVNDFKKMQDDFGKELKRMELSLLNKTQKEVIHISNEIGKAEGYLLILEKKTAGIVYRPDHIDITEQVIKKYNQQVAKSKK